MSITKDATKGWALPASAAEWTELLSGTGIANPNSAWAFQMGSGNASDLIGSLTLTAKGTPQYGVAATGWSNAGVDATDNTTDGFTCAAGVGPDPSTTSQVWIYVVSIETEPTAARTFYGITGGPTGVAVSFQPATGTNKARITVVGVSTTGTADHATGSYVFTVRYDRANSAANFSSDIESLTGTYSATAVDGAKGFGIGSATPGAITLLYAAMWSGANAESLSDANIATIRTQIENPPAGITVEDEPGYYKPEAIQPPLIIQRPVALYAEEFPSANFALEEDWQKQQKQAGHADPLFLPPRIPAGWVSEEWPTPVVAFYLEDDRRYLPFTRPTQKITPRAPLFWGDETIPLAAGGTTVTPLGTTLAAMQTGSGTFKWVAAIEGYGNLLTDCGTTSLVTAAWSGAGFTGVLDGLYPALSMQQRLDPWDAFANTGGRLTLSVSPDATGTFRRDTHLSTPAISTFLTADVDCDDTTYSVKSATAFASSGTAYIGSEAAAYSSKTATQLLGLRRGVYAPFRTAASGTEGFAHPHTVSTDPNNISLPPVVSAAPRTWLGKWVGLWRHLYKGGRLNDRDDAQLCFPGRIVGVRQNPESLHTEIECEHILAWIKRAVLGKDLWSAEVADGVYLFAASGAFQFSDFNGTTLKTATPLSVVSGTPASVYEIKEGRWEIMQLIHALNAWLGQAKADAGISGTYTLSLSNHDPAIGTQIRMQRNIPGTTDNCVWWLTLRDEAVWRFLGKWADRTVQADGTVRITESNITHDSTGWAFSAESVLRFVGNNGAIVELTNERGTYINQTVDQLPANLAGNLNPANQVNMATVMIDGKRTAIGSRSVVAGDPVVTSRFDEIEPFNIGNGGFQNIASIDVKYDDPRPKVQQIFIYVDSFAELIKKIFSSTGTAGYNDPVYDVLPASISLGIPGELLGGPFFASVDQLPGAGTHFTLIITKPVKLVDLLFGDLSLRWAFLRWRDEHLEFWSWMTPVDDGTLLEEANKASPVSVEDEQRSATALDDMWQRNVIKIEYDRDFTTSESAGGYHGHIQVVDRVAIDDGGGEAKVQTINAQNTYSQHVLGGAGGVESLMPQFKAIAPFFTRPVRHITRTISPEFFEGYSVGDVVLVTDEYACDPDTGALGVALRPGILVSHSYTPGGFTPQGTVADMHGEIDVMFLDNLKIGRYVPTAEVVSYDSGTSTAIVQQHAHSGPGEVADASWMSAGRKVRMVEVDPSDPAAPDVSDLTVLSVTGNAVSFTTIATYSSTKTYRLIWDDYPDAIAAQQAYTYQADDADGMVSDTRAPYQYTVNTTAATFPTPQWLKNSPDDAVELPPSNSYGDGVGLDVGTDAAINRLINNLHDFKTAKSTPMLGAETTVLGDTTHSYVLYAVIPINLSPDGLSSSLRRYLYVAPHAKSSDGTGIVRITLARNMPTGSTTYDVDRGTIYGEQSFTMGTSYETPSEKAINIGTIKDGAGTAYILIELNVPVASGAQNVSCRGLGTCYEGPRFPFSF